MVARGWTRSGETVFNVYKVAVWEDKRVLEVDGGNVCTTMWLYVPMPPMCTLSNILVASGFLCRFVFVVCV